MLSVLSIPAYFAFCLAYYPASWLAYYHANYYAYFSVFIRAADS